MKPGDYVEQVGVLVESGRFEKALALAAAQGSAMTPKLGSEEFFNLCGLLEIAQRAVDCGEAIPRPGPGPKPDARLRAVP